MCAFPSVCTGASAECPAAIDTEIQHPYDNTTGLPCTGPNTPETDNIGRKMGQCVGGTCRSFVSACAALSSRLQLATPLEPCAADAYSANDLGEFRCGALLCRQVGSTLCQSIDDATGNPYAVPDGAPCSWAPDGSLKGFGCTSSGCAQLLPTPPPPDEPPIYRTDRCDVGLHNCHREALCTNEVTDPGFSCSCRAGWRGDGVFCTDETTITTTTSTTTTTTTTTTTLPSPPGLPKNLTEGVLLLKIRFVASSAADNAALDHPDVHAELAHQLEVELSLGAGAVVGIQLGVWADGPQYEVRLSLGPDSEPYFSIGNDGASTSIEQALASGMFKSGMARWLIASGQKRIVLALPQPSSVVLTSIGADILPLAPEGDLPQFRADAILTSNSLEQLGDPELSGTFRLIIDGGRTGAIPSHASSQVMRDKLQLHSVIHDVLVERVEKSSTRVAWVVEFITPGGKSMEYGGSELRYLMGGNLEVTVSKIQEGGGDDLFLDPIPDAYLETPGDGGGTVVVRSNGERAICNAATCNFVYDPSLTPRVLSLTPDAVQLVAGDTVDISLSNWLWTGAPEEISVQLGTSGAEVATFVSGDHLSAVLSDNCYGNYTPRVIFPDVGMALVPDGIELYYGYRIDTMSPIVTSFRGGTILSLNGLTPSRARGGGTICRECTYRGGRYWLFARARAE